MFRRLEAEAIPIDQDYAYINTFIVFLDKLVDVIGKMWDRFAGSLGTIVDLLGKLGSTTAAEGESGEG